MARIAGSAVLTAAPAVTSGFTGSYAGEVVCADGRRVFVKAGGPDMPHVVSALEQEAQVLARLPHGIPAPTLVGSGGVEGWSPHGGPDVARGPSSSRRRCRPV